ncbi:unnamed protein product [Schistosoma mattheei]|uniref:Uncharacterized protein n=1 Tax=Schistosoma mattheei TaxID=31246 RepID=A0A183P8R3_9TREM|nr:unnamed protein product [Schistosoma mattheei]
MESLIDPVPSVVLGAVREWLLDRQDVMIHRANDLKILGSEEEYQKVMLFFTDVHSHYLIYFPDGYGYPYRAQDVLECEFILLEAMDCSLVVFHPYRPLVQFCDELRPQMHEYADVLLERACNPDLLIGSVNISSSSFMNSSLSISSNKHGYFGHQTQSTVNPSLVADRWFSELNVDMERVSINLFLFI